MALVDDEDYERVCQHKWHAVEDNNGVVYAATYALRTRLHRFILGITDPKLQVDHEDHNGLNCQKNNLRRCSYGQNQSNRKKKNNCSSRYKGVYRVKRSNRWHAQIRVNYKSIHLGYFPSERGAALAYDTAALKYFGEFALCNFN